MTINTHGDTAILVWEKQTLDASNVGVLKEYIADLKGSYRNLVLDLNGVNFIDSTGLGGLVFTLKRLREAGGDLSLCATQSPVRTLLEMLRMHRMFDIYNEQSEALRQLAANELSNSAA